MAPMQARTYDAIVLGLGAMGSAALYQLAKRGSRVLGIDRFAPPHKFGSSHGDTRITRQAIGEGAEYVPLVLRSHEIWREVEAGTGRSLLETCGGLILSSSPAAQHHGVNFFENTIAAAKTFGIEHELLDASDVRRRFPQFSLQGHERAYFEPGAGFVRPEACIEAQLGLARNLGAEIRTGESVIEFDDLGSAVRVTTNRGSFEASHLILTAGAWIGKLLGPRYAGLFRTYRQVLYWFEAESAPFPTPSPVFIWQLGATPADLIYGFPPVDGPKGGVKIAADDFSRIADPDDAPMAASPEEAAATYHRYIEANFNGVGPGIVRSEPCLYTLTEDYRFVIGRHPEMANVTVASPCSGHGFKHSAAIGEALAEMATTGRSHLDLSSFALPLKGT